MSKIKKAVIPAAGYGTRLYPLTLDKPKALIDIAGRPIIEHLIDKIIKIKTINEIVLVTNHKFFDNFNNWLKENPKHIKISLIDDQTTSNETRLGAIGDAVYGLEKANIDDGILWLSSDNLFNFELARIVDAFEKTNEDVVAVYDVKDINEAKKMGVVAVGKNGKLADFEEKPKNPKSTLCSIGIYIFKKETVRFFKVFINEGNPPDKPGDFVKWLYKKKGVLVYPYDRQDDKWFDIGTLETLKLADKEFRGK